MHQLQHMRTSVTACRLRPLCCDWRSCDAPIKRRDWTKANSIRAGGARMVVLIVLYWSNAPVHKVPSSWNYTRYSADPIAVLLLYRDSHTMAGYHRRAKLAKRLFTASTTLLQCSETAYKCLIMYLSRRYVMSNHFFCFRFRKHKRPLYLLCTFVIVLAFIF